MSWRRALLFICFCSAGRGGGGGEKNGMKEEEEAPAPHFYGVNYLTVNSQLFGTFPSLRIFGRFEKIGRKQKEN